MFLKPYISFIVHIYLSHLHFIAYFHKSWLFRTRKMSSTVFAAESVVLHSPQRAMPLDMWKIPTWKTLNPKKDRRLIWTTENRWISKYWNQSPIAACVRFRMWFGRTLSGFVVWYIIIFESRTLSILMLFLICLQSPRTSKKVLERDNIQRKQFTLQTCQDEFYGWDIYRRAN